MQISNIASHLMQQLQHVQATRPAVDVKPRPVETASTSAASTAPASVASDVAASEAVVAVPGEHALARLDELKAVFNTRIDNMVAKATEAGRDDVVAKLEARRESMSLRFDRIAERIENRQDQVQDRLEQRIDQISARLDEFLNTAETVTTSLTDRAASARENGNEDAAARLEARVDRIADNIDHLTGLIGQRLDRLTEKLYGQDGTPAAALPTEETVSETETVQTVA